MNVVVKPPRTNPDRRFFTWATVGLALVVLAGFSRTFYLKEFFRTPVLPLLVHLHGLLMTSWFVLLIVQARLIATHRVDLHKRVGIFGIVLALAIVVMLVTVSIYSARLGHTPGGPPPLVLLGLNFVTILIFAAFVASALLLRRRGDWHKRLMLLASLSILSAAIVRLPLHLIEFGGVLAVFGANDICVLACVAIDTLRNRRLHPAFGWGALVIIAVNPLLDFVAQTPQWLRFGAWLIS